MTTFLFVALRRPCHFENDHLTSGKEDHATKTKIQPPVIQGTAKHEATVHSCISFDIFGSRGGG